MTWIRWDTQAPNHELVAQLAQDLRIRRAEAHGLYCATCCGFGEHQPDGQASTVTDGALERWADWQGRPGKWAAAFRTRCVDPDGKLHGWWRNEAVLREQERSRRKPGQGSRKARQRPREGTGEAPEGPRGAFPGPSRGNGYGNGDKDPSTSEIKNRKSSDAAAALPAAAAAAGPLAGRIKALAEGMDPLGESALHGYLRAARDPGRLLAELESQVNGVHGPGGRAVTRAQLGNALHAAALDGLTRLTRFRFAKYLLGEIEPPQRASGPPAAGPEAESEFAAAARRLEDEFRRTGRV